MQIDEQFFLNSVKSTVIYALSGIKLREISIMPPTGSGKQGTEGCQDNSAVDELGR